MRFVPFAKQRLFFLSIDAGFQLVVRPACLVPR